MVNCGCGGECGGLIIGGSGGGGGGSGGGGGIQYYQHQPSNLSLLPLLASPV